VKRSLVTDLKTSPDAAKAFQRLYNGVRINADDMRRRQSCQRILDVMRARQLQANRALRRKRPSSLRLLNVHLKASFTAQPDIASRIRRPWIACCRIGHNPAGPIMQPGTQFQTTLTISVQDERRRQRPVPLHIHATNKMFKCSQKCLIIGKELRVLEFYRSYYCQPGMIVPEIVIELVGLIHKVLTMPQPVVHAEARHYCANLTERI